MHSLYESGMLYSARGLLNFIYSVFSPVATRFRVHLPGSHALAEKESPGVKWT